MSPGPGSGRLSVFFYYSRQGCDEDSEETNFGSISSLGALARASIRSAHNVGKVEILKKHRIVSHGSFYCVACVSGRENTKFDDF